MMKLPIKSSSRHRGKGLGVDSEAETITLLGSRGEPLGSVSWEAVIDFIQISVKEARSHRAIRNYPRGRLAAKVRYSTPDDKHFESITCEIGGGGVFIETHVDPRRALSDKENAVPFARLRTLWRMLRRIDEIVD